MNRCLQCVTDSLVVYVPPLLLLHSFIAQKNTDLFRLRVSSLSRRSGCFALPVVVKCFDLNLKQVRTSDPSEPLQESGKKSVQSAKAVACYVRCRGKNCQFQHAADLLCAVFLSGQLPLGRGWSYGFRRLSLWSMTIFWNKYAFHLMSFREYGTNEGSSRMPGCTDFPPT